MWSKSQGPRLGLTKSGDVKTDPPKTCDETGDVLLITGSMASVDTSVAEYQRREVSEARSEEQQIYSSSGARRRAEKGGINQGRTSSFVYYDRSVCIFLTTHEGECYGRKRRESRKSKGRVMTKSLLSRQRRWRKYKSSVLHT